MILLDIFSICNWPILLATWLLSFILGILVAWSFLSKYKKHIKHLEKENTSFSSTINSLRADVESCQRARNNAKSEIELLRGQLLDKDNRIKKSQQAHAEINDLLEKQRKKFDESQQKLKDTEAKLIVVNNDLSAHQEKSNESSKWNKDEFKKVSSQNKNESKSSVKEFDNQEPIRPILNKTNDIENEDSNAADNEEEDMVEIERVKSALTAASVGKVDEIIEKIERKKKKKEKKRLKKLKNQDSDSRNDISKGHEDSQNPSNKIDHIAPSDEYPSDEANNLTSETENKNDNDVDIAQ